MYDQFGGHDREEDCECIATDNLQHLDLYQPAETWQSKESFVRTALQRMESGEHIYTVVEGGKLLHYGWLVESQERAFFDEVDQFFAYPEPGAVLYDFYTHPSARGRGLYQQSIDTMLAEARNMFGAECVYISCLADNAPSRHVIEKKGFSHVASLYLRRIFGWPQRWQSSM